MFGTAGGGPNRLARCVRAYVKRSDASVRNRKLAPAKLPKTAAKLGAFKLALSVMGGHPRTSCRRSNDGTPSARIDSGSFPENASASSPASHVLQTIQSSGATIHCRFGRY